MFNIKWSTYSRLAILLCLYCFAGGSGISLTSAQQYYVHPNYVQLHYPQPPSVQPGTITYTQVMPAVYPPQIETQYAIPPIPETGVIRQVYMEASQPTTTSIQAPALTPPLSFVPNAPPPSPMNVPPQTPTVAVPYSASPPSIGGPIYHNGVFCQECTESHSERACNWLCRIQKKTRSLFRASQRRSECSFEYPVATPTGTPYGYVQPTWSDFSAEPEPTPFIPSSTYYGR